MRGEKNEERNNNNRGGKTSIGTNGSGPELAQIANGMGKLGWKKPMIGSWTFL